LAAAGANNRFWRAPLPSILNWQPEAKIENFIEINEANFTREVLTSSQPVIVDF